MSGSADEIEIRNAVSERLSVLMPQGRIIHELNVAGQGSNRIDVACVTEDYIVAVEIKSKKDTLKRLDEQWAAFNKCCHTVIVAAHEKHFKERRWNGMRDDVEGDYFLDHPLFYGKYSTQRKVWHFPMPDKAQTGRGEWAVLAARGVRQQPHAYAMLDMLWAEELREECERHGLAYQKRVRHAMICDMAWHMTGKEVTTAVCRQLRARRFAHADPPIYQPDLLRKTKSELQEVLL